MPERFANKEFLNPTPAELEYSLDENIEYLSDDYKGGFTYNGNSVLILQLSRYYSRTSFQCESQKSFSRKIVYRYLFS